MYYIIAVFLLLWYFLNQSEKKNNIRSQISIWLSVNPIIKTLLFLITTVITGVLCSSLVTELSTGNSIEWSHFYKVSSFKPLLLVIVIDFIYNWFANSADSDIMKFTDDEYVNAYIKKHSVDSVISRINEDISNGSLKPSDWKKQFGK